MKQRSTLFRPGPALLWLGLYLAHNLLTPPLRAALGSDTAAQVLPLVLLTGVLLLDLRRRGLWAQAGLRAPALPARAFLWYLPLALLISSQLWMGVGAEASAAELALALLGMLCVGITEELIFRGLLLRALEPRGAAAAALISSLCFALLHLLNLLNGQSLAQTAMQTAFAFAIGLLFALTVRRGGSLLPCIVTHSLFDALSLLASPALPAPPIPLLVFLAQMGLLLGTIALYWKRLPEPPQG